jgi:hypothetical protein
MGAGTTYKFPTRAHVLYAYVATIRSPGHTPVSFLYGHDSTKNETTSASLISLSIVRSHQHEAQPGGPPSSWAETLPVPATLCRAEPIFIILSAR